MGFITSPGCPNDYWENLAFNAYAFHQEELDNLVFHIVNSNDVNDLWTQNAAFIAADVYASDLVSADWQYMTEQVRKVRPEFNGFH